MSKKTHGPLRTTDIRIPDPNDVSQSIANIAERSQKLINDFLERQSHIATTGNLDPFNVANAFIEMTTRLMANPTKLVEAQVSLWQDYVNLWHNTTCRMLGEEPPPLIEPDKTDKRFRNEIWNQNELFDFIKQSYLLTSRWIQSTVHDVQGMNKKDAAKIDFYTRQFVDALSPSNLLFTNPDALRATAETGGENLLRGLENLLSDLERGQGHLRISMTDEKAFEIGRNLAATPGHVVYENDMMQLIQYAPSTRMVATVPLLIVPPWINKYYVLDLRDKNSFVKWCVDQGLTTFIISWVNPDASLADRSFEDYMDKGILAALDAIRHQTDSHRCNVLGYCLGGTLLAATLSWLTAHKRTNEVASATFLTTLIDFSEPGDLGVFIDAPQLSALDSKMARTGYLDAADMSNTFNLLRSNDLIWSFVINNYLLGREPLPFDLLYWNNDSTRLPAAMHSFYLHEMYEKNKLAEPGGITLNNVPIDVQRVKTPSYFLSCREDHIAPWKSTYLTACLLSGPKRFVLGASGHVAGVINPPAAEKYGYWTAHKVPGTAKGWLESATYQTGSWWSDWIAWLAKYKGRKTQARDPTAGPLSPIEAAPGRYVRVRFSR